MIKNAKIAIASVLKPVDDVRNFEKIGASLAKISGYSVTTLGIQGNADTAENMTFQTWKPFKRLSLGRLRVQYQFWQAMRKLKPDLIIVTTHELLVASVLYKVFFKCKLVYDVQEDYFKNLWHQRFYPSGIRHLAAIVIRMVELLSAPFFNAFFLAEAIYEKDIRFTRKRCVVLDNKSLPITKLDSKGFKVVFTGTVSHYSKAAESIELFLKLKDAIPEASMTIIGYCPKLSYKRKLQGEFGDKVTLCLSDSPVAHSEIVEQIATASLAIIGYDPNPINEYKIPTKLYEYTAARLPYLVRRDSYWAEIGEELGNAIPVDFEQPDLEQIKSILMSKSKYAIPESTCLWISNEKLLMEKIDDIIG